METVLLALGLMAALVLLMVTQTAARRRRERRDTANLEQNVAQGLHLPPSLHPVIDTDICIGSLACLKACPEGDILGIIGGAARLVHATHCIGHGRCAAECPVNAIKLVFGTAERGVDLPEVDGRFESSRPGVHVVGELGGMGLIRNAVEQGKQCAGFIADALSGRARSGDAVDVAIVGAGPAGLATALVLRERGLSYRLLEQGQSGGAMAAYPRQKVVMTEPLALPGGFKLKSRLVGKAELLGFFQKASGKGGLQIEERVKVNGLQGENGNFVLQTDRGPVAARKVVLATGRRGSPRKLGVPGDQLAKVTYSLTDADQYEGARVLVVGGGDAAVEAAISLAEQGGCEVALSYRQPELSRCRPPNRARAEELAESGQLTLLLPSEVQRVTEDVVELKKGSETVRLPNEYIIACLGGELPLEFLNGIGVKLHRHHGVEKGKKDPAARRLQATLQRQHEEKRKSRRRHLVYAIAGAVVLAYLWWIGRHYYPLPRPVRLHSPEHAMLKPAGPWGHGVGIGATLVMLSNFLYPLRKRARFMSTIGKIRSWMDFHVFVGFMSPIVIAFHAAFQSNNTLATGTSVALGIVVFTGLIGRYIYSLIPGAGQDTELADLLGQWERLKDRISPLLADAADPAPLQSLIARVGRPPSKAPLLVQLFAIPLEAIATELSILRARSALPPEERPVFREGMVRALRLRAQIGLFAQIKRLMRVWRVLHASLAVVLVFAIASHVAVSLYLGYGLGHG